MITVMVMTIIMTVVVAMNCDGGSIGDAGDEVIMMVVIVGGIEMAVVMGTVITVSTI